MRLKLKALIILAVAALAPATRSLAQDDRALLREGLFARDRNVAVTQRPHPEYSPIVQRMGAFNVLPTVTGTVEGNDNIYALSKGEVSDTILRLNPAVTAQSTWSRHQLQLFANLNSSFFSSHSGENTTDYVVGAAGRLDVQRNFGLAGGASYERDTEPRTSSSSPTAAVHPVRFNLAQTFGEATYASPRWRFTARADIQDFSYDNARSNTGAVIYERDRDHTVFIEAGRAEYALVPDTSVFANLVLNQKDYRNVPTGQAKRDSSGYELTVGSNFDLSHVMRGEVFVGYLNQDFDSAAYKGISGLSLRGRLEWFPTQLTTVTVVGGRSVADAGIPGVGGYSTVNVSAQIDHELLRNVILSGALTYGKDDYQNYDRQDERTSEQVSVRYLMNRAVSINVGFSHYTQNSSGTKGGADFDVNRLYAALTYAF